MRTIVAIRYGSHLYGTATPSSDRDFKAVHVPPARDILLGRARGAIATQRAKSEGERNLAGETDLESYSLQKYLALLAEGQTVALDVLFAPAVSHTEPASAEWEVIAANRHRLVTRKSAAFIGYCRQQASKYGIKGARVAAARCVLGALDAAVASHGSRAKLREIAPVIEALAGEHVAVVPVRQIDGSDLPHLDVCGRKLPYSASIRQGRDVLARLVAEYGHRALQAEAQRGTDWKAMSHAVRVASQGLELLRTGRITLPLPNAAAVLAIKLGQRSYEDVADEIEALLAQVEDAVAHSTLPDELDRGWIDDFVAEVYAREIRAMN